MALAFHKPREASDKHNNFLVAEVVLGLPVAQRQLLVSIAEALGAGVQRKTFN